MALKGFEESDIVISTRYSSEQFWQPWTVTQNFWFYEQLFLNWEQEFLSPRTIVWRKLKKPRELKFIDCKISLDKTSFQLKSNKKGYYAVDLQYEFFGRKTKRNLVLFNTNFILANGFKDKEKSFGRFLCPRKFINIIPSIYKR